MESLNSTYMLREKKVQKKFHEKIIGIESLCKNDVENQKSGEENKCKLLEKIKETIITTDHKN